MGNNERSAMIKIGGEEYEMILTTKIICKKTIKIKARPTGY